MPKSQTTRRRIKQDLVRAYNAIDHVLMYYMRLAETMRVHGREEWAETFEALAQQLIIHQKFLKQLEEAW